VRGWPETVLSRGRVVVEDGALNADRGSGVFLRCQLSEAAKPGGVLSPELDPERNFGAEI
jgi:dihydropyrimidinase